MDEISRKFKAHLILRLRKAIRSRGQSMASVERRIGKGRGYVSDALAERKTLTIDLIVEILEALHMNVDAFFSGRLD